MGLKYSGEFTTQSYPNLPSKRYKVDIEEVGYSGTTTNICFGANPITEKEISTNENGYGVRACRFSIEILKSANITIDSLYVSDNFSNPFTVYEFSGGSFIVHRKGYLVAEDVKEIYQDGSSILQISGTDGLELLTEPFEFLLNKKPKGLKALSETVRLCLSKTLFNLNINFSFPYWRFPVIGSSGDIDTMQILGVYQELFANDTFIGVLNKIADTLNLNIYQEKGEWWVVHNFLKNGTTQKIFKYDSTLTFISESVSLGSISASHGTANQPLNAYKIKRRAVGEVITTLDITQEKVNILKNPDLQAGFTDWTQWRASHPIDSYVLGGANTKDDPYHIQINGYQPKNLTDFKTLGGLKQEVTTIMPIGGDYKQYLDKSIRIKGKVIGKGVNYAYLFAYLEVTTSKALVPHITVIMDSSGQWVPMDLTQFQNWKVTNFGYKVELLDSYDNDRTEYVSFDIESQRILDFTFKHGLIFNPLDTLGKLIKVKIEAEDITSVKLNYIITEGHDREGSSGGEYVRWADLEIGIVDKRFAVGVKQNKYVSINPQKASKKIERKAYFGTFFDENSIQSIHLANGSGGWFMSTDKYTNLDFSPARDLILSLNAEILSLYAKPPLIYEGDVLGYLDKTRLYTFSGLSNNTLNLNFGYNYSEQRISGLFLQRFSSYAGTHKKLAVFTGSSDGKEELEYDEGDSLPPRKEPNSLYYTDTDNLTKLLTEIDANTFFTDSLLNINKDVNNEAKITFYNNPDNVEENYIQATQKGFSFGTYGVNGLESVDVLGSTLVKTKGFTLSNDRFYLLNTVYVHRTLGNDNLDFDTYYGATATTGNWFQTIEAAYSYVNKYDGQDVKIVFLGTTLADPYVIDTALIMKHKGEFYIGGNSLTEVAYLSFTTNGRFSGIHTSYNIYHVNIVSSAVQCIALTSNSALTIGNATFTLTATAQRPIAAYGVNGVNIQGAFTVNFGADNQQVFHNNGNGASSVWIGNHADLITLNSNGFTGLKWTDVTGGYNLTTYVINTVSFGQNSYPNIDFKGTVLVNGSGMSLKTQHSPTNFNFALVLGTTSPLRFADLNSQSPNTSSITDRLLMVDVNGKVVLGAQGQDYISNQSTYTQNASFQISGKGVFGEVGVTSNVVLNDSGVSHFNQAEVDFQDLSGILQLKLNSATAESDLRWLIGAPVDDTTSALQVNGAIRQGTVTSSILKADTNGVLVAATATDVSNLIGAGSFIQNQNAVAQNGNYWISGEARIKDTKIYGSGSALMIGSGALGITGTVSLGFDSLLSNTGTNNISIGNTNLQANVGGGYNIALGQNAIKSNTDGNASIGIGFGSLEFMNANAAAGTSSAHNIAIGLYSMRSALATLATNTGHRNVGVGGYALSRVTSGSYNTGLSFESLQDVTTGSYNTGIGRQAGYKIGTGSYNTLFGALAGRDIVGGSNNVVIGGTPATRIASASNWMIFADGQGNERFTIDPNGYFGINRIDPIYNLDVKSSTNNVARLESTVTESYLLFKDSVGSGKIGTENGKLVLYDSVKRISVISDSVVINPTLAGYSNLNNTLEVGGNIRSTSLVAGLIKSDANGVLSNASSTDVTALIAAGSYIINSTNLQASASFNVDGRGQIGNSVSGSFSTGAYWKHFQNNFLSLTNYAIRQDSAGLTTLNSTAGQPIDFAIGNVKIGGFSNAGNFSLGTGSAEEAFHVTKTNELVRLDTLAGSSMFFGANSDASVDYANLGINRHPKTGTYRNTGRTSALISMYSGNGVGGVDFYTSISNGAVPLHRLRIRHDGLVLIGSVNTSDLVNVLQVNGAIKATTISLTTGATVGYIWKCTDATTGAGSWQIGTSTGDSYQGTWDASATYPSATPTTGQWWRITAGGTFNSVTWIAGGDIYYNGTAWVQRPNAYNLTPATASVIGGVSISTGLSVTGAGALSLGTVGTAGTYRSVSTDIYGRVTSGTNPTTISGYGITDFAANANGTLLTGFSSSNSVVSASDTHLSAFGKLQGQISALSSTLSGINLSNYVTINTAQTILQLKTFSNGVIVGDLYFTNQTYNSASSGNINGNNKLLSFDASGYIFRTGNVLIGGNGFNDLPSEKLDVRGNISLTGGLKFGNTLGSNGQYLKTNGTTNIWSNIIASEISDLVNITSLNNFYTKAQVDTLITASGNIQGLDSVLSTSNTSFNKGIILNKSTAGVADLTFQENGAGKATIFYKFSNDVFDRLMIRTIASAKIQIEADGGSREIELYSNLLKVNCLAGSGVRMVTVDAVGNLGSQTIPSGGGGSQNLQSVTNLGNTTTNDIGIKNLYLNLNGVTKGQIEWNNGGNRISIGSAGHLELFTTNSSDSVIIQGQSFNLSGHISNPGDYMVFVRVLNAWIPQKCTAVSISGHNVLKII